MFNSVTLIGNLGKDPEVKTLPSGDKVANLRLATSEKWTDKNTGEKKEKTDWHTVQIFGALADVAEKYTRTGSKVCVVGKLRNRSYEKDGTTFWVTEVSVNPGQGSLVLLDSKGEGSNSGQETTQAKKTPANSGKSQQNFAAPFDDIPF